MNKVMDNLNLLRVLEEASPVLRNAIIKNADDGIICALVEIVLNLLKGNINMPPEQKKELASYKQLFRKLINTCCTKKHKVTNKSKARRIINQSGGALPVLIPLLNPLISKVVKSKVIDGKKGNRSSRTKTQLLNQLSNK
jgi:hypothetical protein